MHSTSVYNICFLFLLFRMMPSKVYKQLLCNYKPFSFIFSIIYGHCLFLLNTYSPTHCISIFVNPSLSLAHASLSCTCKCGISKSGNNGLPAVKYFCKLCVQFQVHKMQTFTITF